MIILFTLPVMLYSWSQKQFISEGGRFPVQCAGEFLGRLLRFDLIKPVSNVRPYVHPSTKSFFDFNEIWYVGRDL